MCDFNVCYGGGGGLMCVRACMRMCGFVLFMWVCVFDVYKGATLCVYVVVCLMCASVRRFDKCFLDVCVCVCMRMSVFVCLICIYEQHCVRVCVCI